MMVSVMMSLWRIMKKDYKLPGNYHRSLLKDDTTENETNSHRQIKEFQLLSNMKHPKLISNRRKSHTVPEINECHIPTWPVGGSLIA